MTEQGVCRCLAVLILAAMSGLGWHTRQVDKDLAHVASRHVETGQTVADAHAVAAVAVETCQAAHSAADEALDAITSAIGDNGVDAKRAMARDGSLRCAIYGIAQAYGKGRALNSEPTREGLRGVPATTPWHGFPADWGKECGYCQKPGVNRCNTPRPRQGGKR